MSEHRLPTGDEIDAAAQIVYRSMPPTPQYRWPLLEERAGCTVWVKHENHSPIGSFKLRGALVAVARLRRAQPAVKGIIAATRGNYGQSVAYAARAAGLSATVVVPHGNSREKNAAMRAFGARLVVHGSDFDEALAHARRLAASDGLHLMPSFNLDLVPGTATYAAELFRAVPDLDAVYVPIGLGSGICGVLAARDALAPASAVIGVVAAALPTYQRSFAAGEPRATEAGETIADGLAVRNPDPVSLALMPGRRGARGRGLGKRVAGGDARLLHRHAQRGRGRCGRPPGRVAAGKRTDARPARRPGALRRQRRPRAVR